MSAALEIGRVTITLMRGPVVEAEIEIHPHSQELTVRERWPNGVERAAETHALPEAIDLLRSLRPTPDQERADGE